MASGSHGKTSKWSCCTASVALRFEASSLVTIRLIQAGYQVKSSVSATKSPRPQVMQKYLIAGTGVAAAERKARISVAEAMSTDGPACATALVTLRGEGGRQQHRETEGGRRGDGEHT